MAYIYRYGRSYSDGYEYDGSHVYRYGSVYSDGWEVDGSVPIPVIALAIGLI